MTSLPTHTADSVQNKLTSGIKFVPSDVKWCGADCDDYNYTKTICTNRGKEPDTSLNILNNFTNMNSNLLGDHKQRYQLLAIDYFIIQHHSSKNSLDVLLG